MDATQFIKEHGVEKYVSVSTEKFHTYFDHSLNDWETADLHCVSDSEHN